VLVLVWILAWEHCLRALNSQWRELAQRTKRDRTLKPRTPDDFPECRLEHGLALLDTQRAVRLWSAVKSRRGRPKEHDIDGQACIESSCDFYKDMDGTHHALRWDGTRNTSENTSSLECGACGRKHSLRLGTPICRRHRCY